MLHVSLRRGVVAAFMVVAALAVLWLPKQAHASSAQAGMSVSVGSPIKLVNGVYLEVPVQATCPVLTDPWTFIFSDQLSVGVQQRTTGTSFASGFGSIYYQSPILNGIGIGTPIVCDGTPQTFTVDVAPDPNGRPFHGGPAVAGVFFNLTLLDSTLNFWVQDQNGVSSGPQSVSIRG